MRWGCNFHFLKLGLYAQPQEHRYKSPPLILIMFCHGTFPADMSRSRWTFLFRRPHATVPCRPGGFPSGHAAEEASAGAARGKWAVRAVHRLSLERRPAPPRSHHMALTPDTWVVKFESLERVSSIRETNESFDICMPCKWLGTSRLPEICTCVKTSVCFTYRIYPFQTFEFFCSCIRDRWRLWKSQSCYVTGDTRRRLFGRRFGDWWCLLPTSVPAVTAVPRRDLIGSNPAMWGTPPYLLSSKLLSEWSIWHDISIRYTVRATWDKPHCDSFGEF